MINDQMSNVHLLPGNDVFEHNIFSNCEGGFVGALPSVQSSRRGPGSMWVQSRRVRVGPRRRRPPALEVGDNDRPRVGLSLGPAERPGDSGGKP